MYCWSLAWMILSITLLACKISTICMVVCTFFGIAFLWDSTKTDFFQFCGHSWVFQICWHIECSTLTSSSFRIFNSSAGISSPPLALFAVMLPKAHLTSDSRILGSRWVTTPLWLSWSLRPFLYSSSVYSCHLFSFAIVRPLLFHPTTDREKYHFYENSPREWEKYLFSLWVYLYNELSL